MGVFKATIEIANLQEGEFMSVEPLVDSGAIYSVFPASLLASLDITPSEEMEFTLADGSVSTMAVGVALFRYDGRERPSTVAFGDEGIFLLGAVTLQELALIPDTTHERLVHSRELHLVGIRAPGFGA